MDITTMNILVTGGAGFIGSNIVEKLLKDNAKFVRIFDNLSTGYMKNIDPLLEKYDNVEFMWGDLFDLEQCNKACSGIDVICHQGALGSVPRSISDPLSSHRSNVDGAFNIFYSAKKNGIKRIVYASSSSVYGDEQTLPKIESKIGKQLSPYAITKHIIELYGHIFTFVYGMECIGLRYFNVFGPRQDPHGAYAAVIPKFIELISQEKQPIINGDGSYSRDFTYIDNVVDANIKALTIKSEDRSIFGDVYNIGIAGNVTILELYDAICKYMDSSVRPKFGSIRDGDIPHSNASIDKACHTFGYVPIVSFDDGIKRTVDYFMRK
jgi:UDP-N-acetylglucosamine/UDP-N-acetylgalactosamine 4-epimerase